jgi:hypothetical protein
MIAGSQAPLGQLTQSSIDDCRLLIVDLRSKQEGKYDNTPKCHWLCSAVWTLVTTIAMRSSLSFKNQHSTIDNRQSNIGVSQLKRLLPACCYFSHKSETPPLREASSLLAVTAGRAIMDQQISRQQDH